MRDADCQFPLLAVDREYAVTGDPAGLWSKREYADVFYFVKLSDANEGAAVGIFSDCMHGMILFRNDEQMHGKNKFLFRLRRTFYWLEYIIGFTIWLFFIRFGVDKSREYHGQDRNKAHNYTNDENWQ